MQSHHSQKLPISWNNWSWTFVQSCNTQKRKRRREKRQRFLTRIRKTPKTHHNLKIHLSKKYSGGSPGTNSSQSSRIWKLIDQHKLHLGKKVSQIHKNSIELCSGNNGLLRPMAFWQYPQMMLWQLQIIGNHHHITLVSTIAMPFFGNALPWQCYLLSSACPTALPGAVPTLPSLP